MKLGVIMDPIASIKIHKDSTFAMLLAAQARGWPIWYMEQGDLYYSDSRPRAWVRPLEVKDDPRSWFKLGEAAEWDLSRFDVLLMRKDPPFDMEYIYSTYLLELAQREGVLVVNRPQSLRDANEKIFCAWFPQCSPATLVTRRIPALRRFLEQQQDIVLKPPDGFGGQSIFRVRRDDPNAGVIMETLTAGEQRTTMAQAFIPEIAEGDRRILMIDGEALPYALTRIPPAGDNRGNLAVGGKGVGVELNDRDHWICQQVGPVLQEKGLLFAGLDIIGSYLTEINVTCPTCIRELDRAFDVNIGAQVMDCIESKVIFS